MRLTIASSAVLLACCCGCAAVTAFLPVATTRTALSHRIPFCDRSLIARSSTSLASEDVDVNDDIAEPVTAIDDVNDDIAEPVTVIDDVNDDIAEPVTAIDDAANSAIASETMVEEAADSEEDEYDEDGEPVKKFQRERHTLFVGNLPFDVTEPQLKDIFNEHVNVQLVSIPKIKDSGLPRGFGFVDVSNEDEIETAIAALDGYEVDGRALRVNKSLTKEEVNEQRKPSNKSRNDTPFTVPEGMKKLYLGNLPYDVTNEQMEFFFAGMDLHEMYLPTDPGSGQGRGFGFVILAEADAETALETLNGLEYLGRSIKVSVPLSPEERRGNNVPRAARRRGDRPNNSSGVPAGRTRLYVGNLSFVTIRGTLTELFEEFGVVHDVYMPEDGATGGTRGFGFVTMDTADAQTAMAELEGCELDGRIIRVNEAQPKSSRNSGTLSDDDDEDDDGRW